MTLLSRLRAAEAGSQIHTGQRWTQKVPFWLDYTLDQRGDPTIERWCVGELDEGDSKRIDGHGLGVVEILECMSSQELGDLVIFRNTFETPSGDVYGRRRKIRTLIGVRRFLKQHGYHLSASEKEREGG